MAFSCCSNDDDLFDNEGPPNRYTEYKDVDEVPMLVDVLDQLGWQKEVFLLGHSRGGSIATATAGSFPSRFRAVITFDSALGMSGLYVAVNSCLLPARET